MLRINTFDTYEDYDDAKNSLLHPNLNYIYNENKVYYDLFDKKISYLETTRVSSQFIDTGIYPDAGHMSVSLDIDFTGSFIPGGGAIFYGQDTSDVINGTIKAFSCNFGANSNQGQNIFAWFGKPYEGGGAIKNIYNFPLQRGILLYDSGVFSYNGKSVNTEVVSGPRNQTLKILPGFTCYTARLYNVIIRYDSITIMNLIPVRIGNVGCLYNTVNKSILKTSGWLFNLGPDIE